MSRMRSRPLRFVARRIRNATRHAPPLTRSPRSSDYREPVRIGRNLAGLLGGAVAFVAVAACGSSGSKPNSSNPVTTVIVTKSPSRSASGSGAASSSASAPPAVMRKLPGDCDSLLPQIDVEDSLGMRLGGHTSFIVGVPEKNIGRLSYLNCRYGTADAAGHSPKVEIGVSLYSTPGQAERRAEGTIEDYREHGARQSKVTVAGQDAILLISTQHDYNVPLLVVTSGQRTVAVSVPTNVLPESKRVSGMSKLAALVLSRTAG